MSLLSKIFGSGKKRIGLLYLNDDRAEAAQISGDLKIPNFLGLNKIGLSKGMVENGEVKMQSEMKNILKDLFSGAKPQAFSAGKMYVVIPFDQLYPFIRVFTKSADEGRIQSDMNEALVSEIPFPHEEVDVIADTKIEDAKMIASAVAVPKTWKSGIKHILEESGYDDLEFIPEPYAQISLSGISDSGNTVLFSFVGSRIYVSVFYAGFLYDSYLYKKGKSADILFAEFQNVNKDFKNSFGKNIGNICFADAPNEISDQIREIFSKEEAEIIFIRPENRFFSDLLDSGYSTSLTGIVKKVSEGYSLINKYLKNMKKYEKGFTLVELIIVIAIIAILAAAIFVAIDPARRLHESRNARRSSDVATILDGIKQYQADNAGSHYIKIANLSATGAYYQIGTDSGGCAMSCVGTTTESSCVDLTDIGTNYLAVIPMDPKDGTAAETRYALKKDINGAITVVACVPEGAGAGGNGTAPSITVTR